MNRKLTLQTIFNKAWRHFVIGKNPPAARKVRGSFKCYYEYRGKECAIGCALPEGHKARKERCSFYILVGEFPDLFHQSIHKLQQEDYGRSLNDFQRRLHDDHIDPNTMKWKQNVDLRAEYARVAADYGLTIPAK